MDQELAQLFASQFGIVPQNGSLQPKDIAMALANQTSNPMMAAVLSQMAIQNTVAEADETHPDHDKCEREKLRLKRMIVNLERQMASAEVMARYIADIFGACPACWGLNRLCQQCRGQGLPGYTDPNLEELRAWVEPALKKGGLYISSESQF